MKSIIVPVDFSSTATNAAIFAGNLAAFYGAELLLYHTFEISLPIGEFIQPVHDVGEMQKAADHEMLVFKETIRQQLKSPIHIYTTTEMNSLQDGLEIFCAAKKPDLVVMGISGNSTFKQILVGSNTIRAIHELKFPILVIPPKASFIPIRKVGFACNFAHSKDNTPVSMLKKIVQDFNADLHIMNVDFHNEHSTGEMLDERFELNEMMGDTKPAYHNIESADITEGVNWFAEKEGLDLVVVIPKKHTALQKMFHRSHSKDLLYHTHLPVLCMHQ